MCVLCTMIIRKHYEEHFDQEFPKLKKITNEKNKKFTRTCKILSFQFFFVKLYNLMVLSFSYTVKCLATNTSSLSFGFLIEFLSNRAKPR